MFLFPLYILGLAAIAAPIIVHMRGKQQRRALLFPSLQFLTAASVQASRWRDLRRWLVLCLRLLVIAALVMAFAHPWWGQAFAGRQAVVVVLDRSLSMHADGIADEYQAIVSELRQTYADADVAVLAAGAQTQWLTAGAGSPFVSDVQQLAELSWQPGYGRADLESAIRLADTALQEQHAAAAKLLVLTDMTQADSRPVQFDRPLSAGTTLEVHDLGQRDDNVLVSRVSHPRVLWQGKVQTDQLAGQGAPRRLEADAESAGEGEAEQNLVPIEALLVNHSLQTRTVQVQCSSHLVDTKAVIHEQTRAVQIPARGQTAVQFTLPSQAGQAMHGRVSILGADDALAVDDQRYFSIPWRTQVTLGLLVHAQVDQRFLQYALAGNDKQGVYGIVQLDGMPLDKQVQALDACDVLLIGQSQWRTSPPTEGKLLGKIHALLGQGLPAVLLADTMDDLRSDPESGHEFFPGALGDLVRLNALSTASSIDAWNADHAIIAPLQGQDAAAMQPFRVKAFRPVVGSSAGQPLAHIGSQAVVVIGEAKQALAGRAVIGIGPDRSWSDWPVAGSWLPLWHETIAYLLQQQGAGSTGAQLDGREPGWYQAEDDCIIVVNGDPADSDLRAWGSQDLWQGLQGSDQERTVDRSESIDEAPEEARHLAWYLLIVVACAALAEMLLANRTAR